MFCYRDTSRKGLFYVCEVDLETGEELRIIARNVNKREAIEMVDQLENDECALNFNLIDSTLEKMMPRFSSKKEV